MERALENTKGPEKNGKDLKKWRIIRADEKQSAWISRFLKNIEKEKV